MDAMDLFNTLDIPRPIMFGTGVVLEAMMGVKVLDSGELSYQYTLTDKEQLIYYQKIVLDKKLLPVQVDGESFKPIAPNFFGDNGSVWGMNFDFKSKKLTLQQIEVTDRNHFRSVGLYYATDGIHSYFCLSNRVIKNDVLQTMGQIHLPADLHANDRSKQLHSFWQSRIALGKHVVYFMGKALPHSDSTTFRKLKSVNSFFDIYLDKNQVYVEDRSTPSNTLLALAEADVASFVVEDLGKKEGSHRPVWYVGDKNGCIYWHIAKAKKKPMALSNGKSVFAEYFSRKKEDPFFKDFWYWKVE